MNEQRFDRLYDDQINRVQDSFELKAGPQKTEPLIVRESDEKINEVRIVESETNNGLNELISKRIEDLILAQNQQMKQIIEIKLEKHIQEINQLIIQNVVSAQHYLTNENGNSSIKDSGNAIGNITIIDNTAIVHLMILFLQYMNTSEKPDYLDNMLIRLEKMTEENRKQYTGIAQSLIKDKGQQNE